MIEEIGLKRGRSRQTDCDQYAERFGATNRNTEEVAHLSSRLGQILRLDEDPEADECRPCDQLEIPKLCVLLCHSCLLNDVVCSTETSNERRQNRQAQNFLSALRDWGIAARLEAEWLSKMTVVARGYASWLRRSRSFWC